MYGKEKIDGLTIRVIPAGYSWSFPLWIPMWLVRVIVCSWRGHRWISNLPAMASGMIWYQDVVLKQTHSVADMQQYPNSCWDCGAVEK